MTAQIPVNISAKVEAALLQYWRQLKAGRRPDAIKQYRQVLDVARQNGAFSGVMADVGNALLRDGLRSSHEGYRLGLRTARTLPLGPPPQKKRPPPSDSRPDTPTPCGMEISSRISPD